MKAIITRNDQTAVLELPTSRMELAGSLSRIGIRTPAHIIPCSDEEEDYIKVKLFGESDFENELTALVTPKDSLGSVDTTLDLYRELPQTQKEKLKAELSQNPPDSLSSLCRKVMDFQPKYVTEDYYFPLTVSVYEYSEYGDLDYDSDCELDGRFANDYADEIKAMFRIITENSMKDAEYADRIAEIEKIITERASHQNEYDDSIVRQMVECIKVYADKHIEVIFGGGYAVEETVE